MNIISSFRAFATTAAAIILFNYLMLPAPRAGRMLISPTATGSRHDEGFQEL